MPAQHDDMPDLCSVTSHAAGEQLFGSMKPHPAWFLLEYDGRWEPDAFEQSTLPAPVKARLGDFVPSAGAHPLLIRQKPRRVDHAGLAFFVALTREQAPALYEFHLSGYDDLLDLDLGAILAEDAAFDGQRRAEPLYLVCTHGRRDRCCARHGLPVYERLAEHVGPAVWQSSHVGGHRFAANVLCFPHGVGYGRVTPENARALADGYGAGQLAPDLYRGRAAYAKPVQAAEYYLRQQTGSTGLEAFALIDSARTSEGWRVRFADRANGSAHTLTLAEAAESVRVLTNCGDAEPSTFTQLVLLGYETASLT